MILDHTPSSKPIILNFYEFSYLNISLSYQHTPWSQRVLVTDFLLHFINSRTLLPS